MKKRNAIIIEPISRKEFQSDLSELVKRIIDELSINKKKPPDSGMSLLTLEETANIFNVSKRTLFNWGKNKLLNPICIGSRVYYRQDAVKKLIEKNELK